MGEAVLRIFDGDEFHGTCTGWLPTTDEDAMLFRIVHKDGDVEDLDEDEATAAVEAARAAAKGAKKKATKKRSAPAATARRSTRSRR